jgi:hypothetical protein
MAVAAITSSRTRPKNLQISPLLLHVHDQCCGERAVGLPRCPATDRPTGDRLGHFAQTGRPAMVFFAAIVLRSGRATCGACLRHRRMTTATVA